MTHLIRRLTISFWRAHAAASTLQVGSGSVKAQGEAAARLRLTEAQLVLQEADFAVWEVDSSMPAAMLSCVRPKTRV
jgi:hypothetical protein